MSASTKRVHRKGIMSAISSIFLVMSAGHPVIKALVPNEVLWPGLICTFGLALVLTKSTISRSSLTVLLFFVLLSIVQLIYYGVSSASSSVGFLLMLVWSLIAVNLIRPFPIWYVRIMSVAAAISLVFYFLALTGLITPQMFVWVPGANVVEGGVHAWLYYFHQSGDAFRNSGPFWEPGAFAGYLELALIFVLTQRQKPNWKPIVLILAVLTTMSTTGYAGLAVIVGIWAVRRSDLRFTLSRLTVSAAAVICFAFMSYWAIGNLSFLGEKVNNQVERVQSEQGNYQLNRFGSLIYDLPFIRMRPLIGWTPASTFRSEVDPLYETIMTGHGNGLSAFVSRFGIPALLFVFWRVFCFARHSRMSRIQGGLLILWVSVILVGEQYLVYPVFWCLIMLSQGTELTLGDVRLDQK